MGGRYLVLEVPGASQLADVPLGRGAAASSGPQQQQQPLEHGGDPVTGGDLRGTAPRPRRVLGVDATHHTVRHTLV